MFASLLRLHDEEQLIIRQQLLETLEEDRLKVALADAVIAESSADASRRIPAFVNSQEDRPSLGGSAFDPQTSGARLDLLEPTARLFVGPGGDQLSAASPGGLGSVAGWPRRERASGCSRSLDQR